MNHKLRVLVRVDLDPGPATVAISGCLTPANFPVRVEVHHELGVAATTALEDANVLPLTIVNPAELPVCAIHGGATDGESALAGMPVAGSFRPLAGGMPAGLVGAGSAR